MKEVYSLKDFELLSWSLTRRLKKVGDKVNHPMPQSLEEVLFNLIFRTAMKDVDFRSELIDVCSPDE